MKQFSKYNLAMMGLLLVSLFSACKKDSTDPEVIASFTFQVDAADYKLVHFTNASQNYAVVSWNFGDQSAVSAEVNPNHSYTTTGDFNVTLTATSAKGTTDVYTTKVTITDPNAELTKLVGETSKTWKLLRVPGSGKYPLMVMPYDRSQVWWALGLQEEVSKRGCMFNDEWKFTRDGLKMDYDAKGDYWAEGGVFLPDGICASTTSMVGPNGEDLSAWGNGSHTFLFTPGATPTLKVSGLGAFVGLCKVGTGLEFKVPQESVTYNVVKLTDGVVDTLVIEAPYKQAAGDATYLGIWQFVLVHYDNPADEPIIEGPKPTVAFDYTVSGQTITCTNTTTDADSYLWDFGDGQTSTELNPTHTFTTDGIFAVRLTATNANGTSTAAKDFYYTTTALTAITDAMLQGAAWKVRVEDKSIFVGDGLGHTNWWSVPIAFLNGNGVGVDDWSCITNDEYKFSAGGVYAYDTKGSTRNDGYFGGTNGCIDDAGIAASGNGAAFGSATHSYAFTAAAGSDFPLITLTNGAGKAAFLGFYKGYNGVASGVAGGENTNSANLPNGGSATNTYAITFYANTGTKEYMVVSVDYSAAHDGSMGWSTILVR